MIAHTGVLGRVEEVSLLVGMTQTQSVKPRTRLSILAFREAVIVRVTKITLVIATIRVVVAKFPKQLLSILRASARIRAPGLAAEQSLLAAASCLRSAQRQTNHLRPACRVKGTARDTQVATTVIVTIIEEDARSRRQHPPTLLVSVLTRDFGLVAAVWSSVRTRIRKSARSQTKLGRHASLLPVVIVMAIESSVGAIVACGRQELLGRQGACTQDASEMVWFMCVGNA